MYTTVVTIKHTSRGNMNKDQMVVPNLCMGIVTPGNFSRKRKQVEIPCYAKHSHCKCRITRAYCSIGGQTYNLVVV